MSAFLQGLRGGVTWCRQNPWRCLWRFGLFVLLCQIWAWAFDRTPPRINVAGAATPYPLSTSPGSVDPNRLPLFPRGSDFAGRWSLTITRACDGTSARWVTSSVDTSWYLALPPQELPANQAFEDVRQLPVRRWLEVTGWRIPVHAPLGEAAYHVRVSFRCNLLHWIFPIVIDYPVIRFLIVEKTAGRGSPTLAKSAVP